MRREKEITRESERWKDVLSQLAEDQYDGTITTRLQSEKFLETMHADTMCKLPFQETMTYLSDEEQRIVRPVKAIKPGETAPVTFYSLGHDAIGLALHKWKVVKDKKKAEKEWRRWMIGIPIRTLSFIASLGLAFLGAMGIWELYLREVDQVEHMILVVIVVLLSILLMWAANPSIPAIWMKTRRILRALHSSKHSMRQAEL